MKKEMERHYVYKRSKRRPDGFHNEQIDTGGPSHAGSELNHHYTLFRKHIVGAKQVYPPTQSTKGLPLIARPSN